MNKKDIIHIILNATEEEALSAWSEACREYELDPSREQDLFDIHSACVEKIMKIAENFETHGRNG